MYIAKRCGDQSERKYALEKTTQHHNFSYFYGNVPCQVGVLAACYNIDTSHHKLESCFPPQLQDCQIP